VPVPATHPGHVWTDDVLHDPGRTGTPLKGWTVMEALTRAGLAREVAPSLPAPRVGEILARLVAPQGAPQVRRRDHGPACIARAVRGWLAQPQMRALDIAPGGPWQNGEGESCNGTVRDACLHMPALHAVAEARGRLAADRRPSQEARPHSRLGDHTPVEFKRDWQER
jgi:putative transposase